MVTILTKQNSIANHFLAELRDVRIQTDRMRFRRNLERLGEVMAYEISKTFEYKYSEVETPLGVANTHLMSIQPAIATIIRPGLPLHQRLLTDCGSAQSAFIAADRHTNNSGEFEIHKKDQRALDLDGKIGINADPMFATGHSLV